MDFLTVNLAYKAMYVYFENLYETTRIDDLGGILGGMSLLPDGGTADPAIWSDWIDSVKKVNPNINSLTFIQAYEAMCFFLQNCYLLTNSKELAFLLKKMKLRVNQDIPNSKNWKNWLSAINKVRKKNLDISLKLSE